MRVCKRILLGLGILLFALEIQAQVTLLLRRPSAVAAAACLSSDTTNSHNKLLEGFQNVSTFFEETWTVLSIPLTSTNYDTSGVFFDTNRPPGACTTAMFTDVNINSNYMRHDFGVSYGLTPSTNAEIVFHLFLASSNIANDTSFSILYFQEDATPVPSGFAASITYEVSGAGVPRLYASGSANSSVINLLKDQWNIVHLHLDGLSNACSITVNSTSQSFTRYTHRKPRYLFIGPSRDLTVANDKASLWWDLITTTVTNIP